MSTPISFLKIAGNNENYEIPVYSVLDFPEEPLRIMTNNGVGCLKLVDEDISPSISLMTNKGIMRVELSSLPTIVKDGLLTYHNYKVFGGNGDIWRNLAPNRTLNATARRMTFNGNSLVTNMTYGSYVELTVPEEIDRTTSPFTIEMRVSHSNLPMSIMNGYNTFNSVYSSISVRFDRILLRFIKRDNSELFESRFNFVAPNNLTANTFRTISFAYDGNTSMTLYVDGIFIGNVTTSVPVYLNNHNVVYLGESSSIANSFKFIRIYNRVLTQEEITKNHLVGDEVGI